MRPVRNADGTLTVPMPGYGDGIEGDGSVTIGPEHPMYESWAEWIRLRDAREAQQ